MITHYGLFWSAADVLWSGRRGKKGCLLGRERSRLERKGRPTRDEYERSIDYSEYIGIYCLYRDSQLIYVGEAGLGNSSTLYGRIRAHRSDNLADWWDEFSWFGRSPSATRTTAEVVDVFAQMEAVLIAVNNPGFNKQSGTFVGAIPVFQVPNEAAGGNTDTKLERLMAKLENIEMALKKAP